MGRKKFWLYEKFKWRKGKKGLDSGQLSVKQESRESIIKEFLLRSYEQTIPALGKNINLKRVLPLPDEQTEEKMKLTKEEREKERKRKRIERTLQEMEKLGIVRVRKINIKGKRIKPPWKTYEFGVKLLTYDSQDKQWRPTQLDSIERLNIGRWFRDKLLGQSNEHIHQQKLKEKRIKILSKWIHSKKLTIKEKETLEKLNSKLGKLSAGELIVLLEKNKMNQIKNCS